MRPTLALAALCVAATACRPTPVTHRTLVTAAGEAPLERPLAEHLQAHGARPLDVLFDGSLRLVGVRAPAQAQAGTPAALTLWWLVEDEPADHSWRVFVHGAVPGSEVNQAGADHDLVGGAAPTLSWKKGQLLEDTFSLPLPRGLLGDRLQVFVGLYESQGGKTRAAARPKEQTDGKDRVLAVELNVQGGASLDVRADVVRRTGAIVVDGVLDEPDWQRATPLSFQAYDGKSPITRKTTAKLLWDDDALYVAFEAADPDVFTPYTKRDEPLYESEVVELFIDADGDQDEYVELQAAANDVQFDAAFRGGRRKNFDTSFDARFVTKARVDGTFGDGSDVDRGFVSEWRVDLSSLRDIPPGEPRVGASWRINLFRLERLRRGDVVRGSEASAWSPPLSGDFHNLDRFGTITFVDAIPGVAASPGE